MHGFAKKKYFLLSQVPVWIRLTEPNWIDYFFDNFWINNQQKSKCEQRMEGAQKGGIIELIMNKIHFLQQFK